MTVRELLARGRALLSSGDSSPNKCSSNIENPALDAALLLAQVLETNREGLVLKGNEEVSGKVRGCFTALLERRLGGECTAYILGRREFFGLEFLVNPNVLVPRPDTEILVEKALETGGALFREKQSLCVLDLCTGSGAIAVSLKHERKNWDVWASDISAAALNTARENAARLLPKNASVRFIESDVFEKIEGRFDLIVSNPPYVVSAEINELAPEVRNEPHLALDGGEDGLDLVRRVIEGARGYLVSGGALLLEADPRQMKNITKLLLDRGFGSIATKKDLGGNERIIGGALLDVSEPAASYRSRSDDNPVGY